MTEALVRVRDFVVRRGSFTLEVPLWTVPAGGVVGVVGPNGAGRTALPRLLPGLDALDAGEVRVLDRGRVLAEGATDALVPDGWNLEERMVAWGIAGEAGRRARLGHREGRRGGRPPRDLGRRGALQRRRGRLLGREGRHRGRGGRVLGRWRDRQSLLHLDPLR